MEVKMKYWNISTVKVILFSCLIMSYFGSGQALSADIDSFDINGVKLGDDVQKAQGILKDQYNSEMEWTVTSGQFKGVRYVSDKYDFKYQFSSFLKKGFDKKIDISLYPNIYTHKIICINRKIMFDKENTISVEKIITSLKEKYGKEDFAIPYDGTYRFIWSNANMKDIKDNPYKYISSPFTGVSLSGKKYIEKIEDYEKGIRKYLACHIVPMSENGYTDMTRMFTCELGDFDAVVETTKKVSDDFKKGEDAAQQKYNKDRDSSSQLKL